MNIVVLLIGFLPLVEAVSHSCQDVYYANQQNTSGTYRIYNKNQQVYDVWCEFHQNYGYAFVSNLSRVDINIDDLYTDTSHVILRHITSSGDQKEIEVKQLSRYRSQPLAFFYNRHDGYAAPQNHVQLGPYLYLGFLPISIANNRNVQGYQAGGIDLVFQNCDSNPNSYLALFFNSKNSDAIGYYQACCPSPLITYWTKKSAPLQRNRYMESHYYFTFEMHMGGCGGYEISLHQDLGDITGAAIGFRFDIKDPCASSPCQNGGSCFPDGRSYTCECTESFTGALCQSGSVP